MDTTGERIKHLRKTILNKTQKEFGSTFGLKSNSISDIENGKNNPTEQTIKAICREFNVSEKWLRSGEGEPFLPEDRETEILRLANKLLTEPDDSFKSTIISAILETTPEEWKVIERMAKRIIQKKKGKE